MPIRAYAFDAYGTLFDVHAAISRHRQQVGADADALSALWRAKQLEYSWVRALSGTYRDFWSLTQEALDFALARFPAVDPAVRLRLLDSYWRLDAYADVAACLLRLRQAGHLTAIFTNGTVQMAEAAASASAVLPLVDVIVSVDEIGIFKTHPRVYQHLAKRLDLPMSEIALVSSNRWDIAGGVQAGITGIWVNRIGMPDEYADLPPSRVITGLAELRG